MIEGDWSNEEQVAPQFDGYRCLSGWGTNVSSFEELFSKSEGSGRAPTWKCALTSSLVADERYKSLKWLTTENVQNL